MSEKSKKSRKSDKSLKSTKSKKSDKSKKSNKKTTGGRHDQDDDKEVVSKLHFHYDQSGNLIAESDDNGNVIREYIYLGNFRIAMAGPRIKPGSAQPDTEAPLALYYIHNDHLMP